MTLIELLRDQAQCGHTKETLDALNDAADAIETLQAENESLRNGVLDLQTQLALTCSKLATLEADAERLDWLQAQEPVKRKKREMTEEMRDFHARGLLASLSFWCHLPVEDSDELARFMHKYVDIELPAPKQAEPNCRIELVVAIHTLASHYENRLGRLDPEDRKLAEGDIAHAMKIAAKWNWNGTSPTPPEAKD